MKLTMQQIHSYQDLVKKRLAPSIETLLGYENEILLPELINDEIVFKTADGSTKISLGSTKSETIILLLKNLEEYLK